MVKAWLLESLKQENTKAGYWVRPCLETRRFENLKERSLGVTASASIPEMVGLVISIIHM